MGNAQHTPNASRFGLAFDVCNPVGDAPLAKSLRTFAKQMWSKSHIRSDYVGHPSAIILADGKNSVFVCDEKHCSPEGDVLQNVAKRLAEIKRKEM